MVRRRQSASSKRHYRWILVCAVLGSAAVGIAVTPVEQAHLANEDDMLNHSSFPLADYDFYHAYDPLAGASPDKNALVRAGSDQEPSGFSDRALRLGYTGFSTEALHTQGFLADTASLLARPISTWSVLKTIWRLDGLEKSNFMEELKQDLVATEPRLSTASENTLNPEILSGLSIPLGITIFSEGLTLKAGVTCVFCHATLHPETGQVIETQPSQDLNLGLLMAVASSSSLFFNQPGLDSPESGKTGANLLMKSSQGERQTLSNPELLRPATGRSLLRWPAEILNR